MDCMVIMETQLYWYAWKQYDGHLSSIQTHNDIVNSFINQILQSNVSHVHNCNSSHRILIIL